MVVNGRPMKRMKSRVTADLYDFLTFPSSAPGSGFLLPFRANIKAFLARHALVPPPSSLFPYLMTWQILFRVGDVVTTDASPDSFPTTVCLDVVEEDVARSRSVYCDQCRVVGKLVGTELLTDSFSHASLGNIFGFPFLTGCRLVFFFLVPVAGNLSILLMLNSVYMKIST
ncbi:hypothetical protein SLEP1_g3097 [Rubroshorea leprosula]|uniref:Uncharacterized protein n=1 Tax=Rubroshorea leprosula TaxID=152421 RepID=A0AAV5HUQ0_9ROSI|nr:hypothetical protein SLEP1_g3097 [Rubroshorea leprosula]